MSAESAPKVRFVLCPRCRRLLQESPDFDVYKCGGCGTVLQAKKRRSGAVSSKSSTHETDRASRNALDPVSDDKQQNKGEQLVVPKENGLRVKATSSSSGECSADGNHGRDQVEIGECDGEKVVLPQETGETEKEARSSSGDGSSDGNDERVQIENGECNGEHAGLPQETGETEKEARSSSGDGSLDGNDERVQIENGECNEEQAGLPQENGERIKETRSSSGDSSSDGNDERVEIENGEYKEEQVVLPQENGERENATRSSSGDCSSDGDVGRSQMENGKSNREQTLLPRENGFGVKPSSSSSGESCLAGNAARDQIENGKCNGEQIFLPQGNGSQGKASSSSSGEYSLDGYGGRDQIQNDECNGEHLGPHGLSDEELEKEMSEQGFSKEPTNLETKASSEWIAENSVENENDTKLELPKEELSGENMPSEGAGEELVCEDVNDEKSALVDITGTDSEAEELDNGNLLPERAEQELISGSDGEEAKNEVDITGSNKTEAEKELIKCASDGEDPKTDQSAQVCANSVVEIIGSASAAERSSTENFLSERGNVAHCKPEEGTYDNVSSNKQPVRSVDTSDAIEVINPSSELSGNLGELSKSSTTRSSHAYEGSVSSNDGVDERFLGRQVDSLDITHTVANGVLEGRSRKGKGLVDSMLYGDLEPQHQSYLPRAKHHPPKARIGEHYQVQAETTRLGLPMRTKEDEFPSRMPFYRSGSQSGYESGSPSNQTYSTFRSADPNEDPDQEHIKLLRMFYKLQDQLNRTRYVNEETNGRLSTNVSYKGNHNFAYNSLDLHEGRFYHGLDYPRCNGRCSHRHQRHNFSQPYLAEATTGSHHVDHPCFHCCSQELQCSAELPPQAFYRHSDLCKYHSGHSCCSSHHSLPSSPPPPWFVSSKVPAYGEETKSGDQMHMAPEVRIYPREKQNFNKRHYRPVAGGAPFVTCHKCLKLLRLPADFLLFKRVYHQLKCGACSEVLKFSLQNRSHIVSYAPNVLGSPSSDLDNRNEMIIGSNLHSASHADPVSYSDDFGHSVSKSYSSEGDPVSLIPSYPSHGNEHDNQPSVVSQGNFEPIAEQKIASSGPSTNEIQVGTEELALQSSNMSGSKKLPSEKETRSPQKSSLHQLMGYSSPSQVIRGVKSFVEGEETILNGEDE